MIVLGIFLGALIMVAVLIGIIYFPESTDDIIGLLYYLGIFLGASIAFLTTGILGG